MARSFFAITAPSDSVRLDSRNQGEVVLTVTNLAGRALRGRARVVPQDPRQSSWIKINGAAEREFGVNGTQQFTVVVDVPNDGAVGQYSFRFDAVSVELPDEEYTQGPTIKFAPFPPPTPQKSSFPAWLIAVLAAGGLAIVGFVIWFVMRSGSGTVMVPNVGGGMMAGQAEKRLRAFGLMPVRQEQASMDFQKGQVIKTDPAAGTRVNAGTKIKLLVAGKTVKVPENIVGMMCPNAANTLGGMGLIPQLVGDGKGADQLTCDGFVQVEASSPGPGQPVLVGSQISLTVPGPATQMQLMPQLQLGGPNPQPMPTGTSTGHWGTRLFP